MTGISASGRGGARGGRRCLLVAVRSVVGARHGDVAPEGLGAGGGDCLHVWPGRSTISVAHFVEECLLWRLVDDLPTFAQAVWLTGTSCLMAQAALERSPGVKARQRRGGGAGVRPQIEVNILVRSRPAGEPRLAELV